jgi:hypothetical protein
MAGTPAMAISECDRARDFFGSIRKNQNCRRARVSADNHAFGAVECKDVVAPGPWFRLTSKAWKQLFGSSSEVSRHWPVRLRNVWLIGIALAHALKEFLVLAFLLSGAQGLRLRPEKKAANVVLNAIRHKSNCVR